MSKNITLAVSDETYAAMKAHPEINWSEIARQGIESFVHVIAKVKDTEKKMREEWGIKSISENSGFSINGSYNNHELEESKGRKPGTFSSIVKYEATITPGGNIIEKTSKGNHKLYKEKKKSSKS
jgi:hypothetical protein